MVYTSLAYQGLPLEGRLLPLQAERSRYFLVLPSTSSPFFFSCFLVFQLLPLRLVSSNSILDLFSSVFLYSLLLWFCLGKLNFLQLCRLRGQLKFAKLVHTRTSFLWSAPCRTQQAVFAVALRVVDAKVGGLCGWGSRSKRAKKSLTRFYIEFFTRQKTEYILVASVQKRQKLQNSTPEVVLGIFFHLSAILSS